MYICGKFMKIITTWVKCNEQEVYHSDRIQGETQKEQSLLQILIPRETNL